MDKDLGLTIDVSNIKIQTKKSPRNAFDMIRSYNKNIIYVNTPRMRRVSSEYKYQTVDSILHCAKISKFAYNNIEDCYNNENVLDFLRDYNEPPILINKNGSQAWILKKGHELFISFCSSNKLKEATENTYASKKKFTVANYDYGKVHKGFYTYYENMRHELLKHIIEYLNNEDISRDKKKIIFTGHNFAGSSILCALETAILFPVLSSKIICVTFGSPRVGDKQFRESCKCFLKSVYRIVTDDDILKHTPSSLRFIHSHPEINIDNEKSVDSLEKNERDCV